MLGGAQSLHTNARDEALALPTEESARLALRTQQILAYESGVTETPDPLAGSYFVESLTTQLEAAAQDYLDEIDAMGGTLAAIEGGFQQRQIQESAYRVQAAIERGDLVVVGVNKYRDDAAAAAPPKLQRIDPEGERRQIERVRRVRAERDPAAWEAALRRLEDAAAGDENLLPALIEAVEAYATVGEISDRLRAALGRASRADHGLMRDASGDDRSPRAAVCRHRFRRAAAASSGELGTDHVETKFESAVRLSQEAPVVSRHLTFMADAAPAASDARIDVWVSRARPDGVYERPDGVSVSVRPDDPAVVRTQGPPYEPVPGARLGVIGSCREGCELGVTIVARSTSPDPIDLRLLAEMTVDRPVRCSAQPRKGAASHLGRHRSCVRRNPERRGRYGPRLGRGHAVATLGPSRCHVHAPASAIAAAALVSAGRKPGGARRR